MHLTPQDFKELSGLKGITYAALNICPVTRKIEDLQIISSQSKLDLLLLNETWLNQTIGDLELQNNGYSLHHYDR